MRRAFKIGKPEERRARGRGCDPVKRQFVRFYALVDLGLGIRRLQVFEVVMGKAVMADGVTFGGDPSNQRRVRPDRGSPGG